jgi:hypothetical protein
MPSIFPDAYSARMNYIMFFMDSHYNQFECRVSTCPSSVRSTVRHAIQLQLDISANTLKIRAVQSSKCKLSDVLDCTCASKRMMDLEI